MKRTVQTILSVLLVVLMLSAVSVPALAVDGVYGEKTATAQSDGTYDIHLRAYQSGRVVPVDVVMILDVSGSMECSEIVPYDQIDPAKTYCIKHVRTTILEDGSPYRKQYNIPVHNVAPLGQAPQWYGQLEETGPETQVFPKNEETEPNYYDFYTGAMEPLRRAATSFAASVADNAELYNVDHRIAVVEFSSPTKKSASSLCTHDNPFYANILSGGTPATALVSAKNNRDRLNGIFADLTASGPTYSDDAMAQAEAILNASPATGRNRIVILFTDGGPGSYGWGTYDLDSSSFSTANNAIACASRMKAQGVKVYTIGVFNVENLTGTLGQLNSRYLNYVSSNYPDASNMNNSGTKASEDYCSMGSLQMDLSGAFADISTIIGEPIASAEIRDTISPAFYLTTAQKQAILTRYPKGIIKENDDGTTSIRIPDVDLPAVDLQTVNDPGAQGVFDLTFSVTAKAEFLGGQGVFTNTGDCGVYTKNGVQLSAFPKPKVDVPVSETALDAFLKTGAPEEFYIGNTLKAEDLYTDCSNSPMAQYADVQYTVTDADGRPFTSGSPTVPTTYTVRVAVTIDGTTYTRQQTVTVVPQVNAVVSVQVWNYPTKIQYYVGDTLSLDGYVAYAKYKDGTVKKIDNAQVTANQTVFTEPGERMIVLDFEGVTVKYRVKVAAVEAVRMIVKSKPEAGTFVYKKAPDFKGLSVEITFNNGTVKQVNDLSQMQISPLSDARVRRGSKAYRVTAEGVSADFVLQVKMVWWQWLIVILLFGWIWY